MKVDVKFIDKLVWSSPDAARALLESDLRIFTSYFFWVRKKKTFYWHEYLLEVADVLTQVHAGLITLLIINLPPRYHKTELAIIMFSAWGFAKNHSCENIHLSYGEPLALDNSDAVRSIVKSREFQHLWPDCKIVPHKDGKGAWATKSGGVFKATAAGMGVTGFGAGSQDENETGEFVYSGCISIDDPLKPQDARSDPKREAVNRNWDEVIKSRRNNSRTTPVIVTMQRIHELDFCAMLLKDTEFHWHRVIMPALLYENTPQEKPLCEAKHTHEQLIASRKKNAWQFAGQMQQDPTPEGGGIIKAEWWPYYTDLDDIYRRCNFFFMTADTAYTKNQANDPSVIHFWGCEGAKRMYSLDQIRGWWEFPDLLLNAEKFWKKHNSRKDGKKPRFLYVEAKASGKSLAQTLRTNGIKGAIDWNPKDWNFPEDKVGRVNETTWPIMNGDIWLPDESIAPWVTGFVTEHTKFTTDDTHANDDQVDNTTMAYSVWRHYGGGQQK